MSSSSSRPHPSQGENIPAHRLQHPSGIVVTAPSSPESPTTTSHHESRRHLFSSCASPQQQQSSHVPSFHPMNNLEVPDHLHSKSHFELLLDAADLPEPGPALYAARQRLWRLPLPRASSERSPEHPAFERMLKRRGGKLDSDETWRAGLDKVWKGIMSGAKLKQNMPLPYLIQILQAGWIQDGTWPRGAVVQMSDDDLMPQPDDVASTATPDTVSALPTPITGTE